ncbi:sigma-70 family RNA polymerase sigma factor [Kitasatospora sp. NPDC085879]|uniref:BACON domain-containing protein n=1 Tax=Kitasatospora sp. NPDC085879 TaxID=3154769 RepID=UPI00342808CE
MTSLLESPVTAGSPVLRAYGQHVDGLFTYCLSVLCEHDAAVAAVAEVRDLALRHGARLADPALRRAWLYALARHCCLRRLESGPDAAFAGTAAREPAAAPAPAGVPSGRRAHAGAGPAGKGRAGKAGAVAGGIGRGGAPGAAVLAQRREELARLAWPEAAGTGPEQREALELAVRHGLAPGEVAAVLALPVPAAEELLETAAAEVGRTRAALLVLAAGDCPELAQLGGAGADGRSGWVLGPALRRELVQHVVACPTCRGTAERVAAAPEPGLAGLPLLSAPVTVRVAGTAAQVPGGAAGAAFLAGAAAGRRLAAPEPGPAAIRFDQRGFPRHRAPSASLALVRQRVVTTGVLAAVLTAPVVALWAAYRGGGEGVGSAAPVSSVRVDSPRLSPDPSETVQPAEPGPGDEAADDGLRLAGAVAETLLPVVEGAVVPVPSHGSRGLATAEVVPAPPALPAGPGRLTVEASEWGSRTVITLTNSGGTAIHWHAVVGVDWLRLSRDEGTLEPGQRITVTVTVDEERVPAGHWTAKIALPPSEAVVTLEGGPTQRGGHPDGPADSGSPTPAPTAPGTGSSTGTGTGSGTGGAEPGGGRSPEPPSGTGGGGSTRTPGGGSGGGTSGPSADPSPTAPADSGPAHGGDPAAGGATASPPPSDAARP